MLQEVIGFGAGALFGAGVEKGQREYRSLKYFGEWEETVLRSAEAGKSGEDEEEQADNERQQEFMTEVMTSRNRLDRSTKADELRDDELISELKETLDSLNKSQVVSIARAFRLEVDDGTKNKAVSELLGAVKHTDQPEVLKQLKTLQDTISLPEEQVKEQAEAAGLNTEDRDKSELAMSLIFGIKQQAA